MMTQTGAHMHDTSTDRLTLQQYVQRLFQAYRNTPGTLGRIRPEDRQLADQLYRRGIPLSVLETAFALAAARRGFRPFDAPPLNPIRSLRYFLPVLDEILSRPPCQRTISPTLRTRSTSCAGTRS